MLACLLAKRRRGTAECRGDCLCPLHAGTVRLPHGKAFPGSISAICSTLLKANAARKLKAYPDTLPVSRQLKKVRRIREFDDLITIKFMGSPMPLTTIVSAARHAAAPARSLSRR